MKLIEETKEFLEYIQSLFDKEIYAVGGCVRDLIMGNRPKDYDFCTSLLPDEIESQLKGIHKTYGMGKRFGTIIFKAKGQEIEITTFRKSEKYGKSRKPEVEFGTDLLEDLKRRDYTINSICISCTNFKLIDPFNGQLDIENKIIRTVGHARHRFREDPLRLIRGIRFASRFGFEIEEITKKRMKDMAYSLLRISKERWVSELDKILLDKNVYNGLKMLWKLEIFKFIIPELQLQWEYDQNSRYHNLELWDHTAHVVESAQKAGEPIEMLYAATFHDIAKPFVRTNKEIKKEINHPTQGKVIIPSTKSNYVFHELVGAEIAYKICTYLKFSKKRTEYVVNMIRTHLESDCPLKKYDDMHKSKLAGELDGIC